MKIKKILVVMVIATLILTMAVATASATTEVKNEKKDTGISIESKEKKVSSYKVTWNANGGKIGSKKTKVTTVKRGSKIGKFPATPKRSEYTFKGWYTKKSGGKKITKATKITKKVTYYAQWQKKSRTLNAEEKKLVGTWNSGDTLWIFDKDGTFSRAGDYSYGFLTRKWYTQGSYSLKNGVLTIQARSKKSNERSPLWTTIPWGNWSTSKDPLKFGTEDGGMFGTKHREYGKQYIEIDSWAGKHYKED